MKSLKRNNHNQRRYLMSNCVDPKALIWAKHVPIVEKDGTTFVYLNDEIEIPGLYSELIHNLYNATEDDSFAIIINNGGGVVETAVMLVDAINRTPATVNCLISGFAASAATIIALACDNLEIAEHSSFMVHNYSGGLGGKGHELKARQQFMDKALNNAFKSFYAGFLTEEEMQEVIDGKDFWFAPDEVRERWENRKQFLGE